MSHTFAARWIVPIFLLALAAPPGGAQQASARADTARRALLAATTVDTTLLAELDSALASETSGVRRFSSRADSLEWETARRRAENGTGLHVVISLFDRRLWAMMDDDTLMTAPIAIGKDSVLEYQGKRWEFRTPRSQRTVLGKDSLPVWIPPEWHYYEVAKERGLLVRHIPKEGGIDLGYGRRLGFRFGVAGVTEPDGHFTALPTDEEIVFDGILYIPPIGTRNRQIRGELGRYRLDLGGGYLLHGTPHQNSIGTAATHGCIRLRDEDIAWLYEFIPVGTRVYIY